MIDISKEADACASWPTRERLRALKRIIPRARVEEALARTGPDRRCGMNSVPETGMRPPRLDRAPAKPADALIRESLRSMAR